MNKVQELFHKVQDGYMDADEGYVEFTMMFNTTNRDFMGLTIDTTEPKLIVRVGSKIKRVTVPQFNGTNIKQFISINTIYTIDSIKRNYRGMDIAIAFKTDDNYIRWYSYRSVQYDYNVIKY